MYTLDLWAVNAKDAVLVLAGLMDKIEGRNKVYV
jgi:hypothetical protein